MEIVARQSFDLERIVNNQQLRGKMDGVYVTTQLETARYFADLSSRYGLGPAVVRVTVEKELFFEFLVKNGIPFETPVDRRPGATETLLPFASLPRFQTLSPVFMHQE